MNDEREELLLAWMNMNMRIRGNRLLKTLSFNEMLVLSLLYRAEQNAAALTAADLSAYMRVLKSEMNKLLNGLAAKQLITRMASETDKRKMEVRLNQEQIHVYLEEHQRVMRYLDCIVQKIGMEKTAQLAELLRAATEAVDEEANRP